MGKAITTHVIPQVNNDEVIEYYTETSIDYGGWSKDYNMHFGYFAYQNWWQCIRDIWRLEPQLEQANQQVFENLNIQLNGRYLDMGCGLGATARAFANRYPSAKLTGITIVNQQVQQARQYLANLITSPHHVDFQCMDYEHTDFADNTFDGIYALESACYAKGQSRQQFIAEAYRILKPKGKMVIHDVFTLKPPETGNALFRYCYKWLCKGWAVENYIDKSAFEQTLIAQGFTNIRIKNAFWHVLPSALHMPRVIITYAIQKMLFSRAFYTKPILRKQRIRHCMASISAIVVSLHLKRFGYYIVTAEKGIDG